MTLIPEGYCRVTLTFNNGGAPRPAQVTFGVNQPDEASIISVAEAVRDDGLLALVQATCTNDIRLTNIHVKAGPVTTGPFVDLAVSMTGAQASDAPPSMACLNVSKITATGGRRGRGRMYWPGFPESALLDDGSFDTGFLDQVNDAFEDWRAALDADDHTLVLLHQSGSPTPNAIEALRVGSRPATQRRRNRRG